MNIDVLVDALFEGARDDAEEIALEALTEPYTLFWFCNEQFVGRFVDVANGAAHVRWADAIAALDRGELPADTYQQNLLRLAASQAAGVPVSLRACTIPRVISMVTLTDAAARHDASRSTS